MKNFKEKILKIGKRKNCFIALLLVALIAFGIVTGLKGSNSANSGAIKANAFTEAPQPKNLDLNGIRYTYQTSLNELKNDYKMFFAPYQNHYISITTTPDEETAISFEMVYLSDYTEALYNSNKEVIQNNIEFYFNNEKFNYTVGTLNANQTYPLTSNPQYEFNEINNFNNITQIQIDFYGLQQNIVNFYPNYTGYLVQFYYVPNNFNPSETENIDYIYENTIIYNYVLSNPTKFKFELPQINNYKLTNIFIVSGDENTKVDTNNYLEAYTLDSVFSLQSLENPTTRYYSIEELKLIVNNNANIASFKMNVNIKTNSPLYQGNLLLSEEKYDFSFVNDIANSETYGSVLIEGDLFWGGNVNNNPPSYSSNGSIVFYVGRNTASLDAWHRTVYSSAGQMQPYWRGFGSITYVSGELYGASTNNYRIYYENQSRLIFLSKPNTLNGEIDDTKYDALATQVEDTLFNVSYIGDIEQNERNERIEEDFNNLIKTVGLGAFIGLLIGILIGTPGLGLAIGAFIGLAVGIAPLLIDGLQAIFGNDFLSGLYDFFKQITEFFVNIVDTIIEFLMNIITNPFILILIVIIAIIYIVKRYNK